MKRIISLVTVIAMLLVTVFSMSACGPAKVEKNAVQQAIEKAMGMTQAELEAKAKEEIGTNTLMIKGISSGFQKIGKAFATKYGIAVDVPDSISKDTEVYTAFNAAIETNAYYADIMLLQDTNSLLDQINMGNLYNYVPKGLTGIVEEDKDPLVGVYLNKNFIYKKANAGDPDTLTNVWQLAGSKEDAKHISKLSFQKPTTEGINMSMLVMLTSDEYVAKLEAAYKSYYGKDYDGKADNYKNIGYKFIAEYVKNVTTWHTSDTTAVKDLAEGKVEAGTIIYAPFNKYKDAEKVKKGSTATFTTTGYNSQIEGFNGYLYKMYLQIPKTAKYPYTACLMANYMFEQEALTAGWGGNIGYYSPKDGLVTGAKNDLTVPEWKANNMVVENPKFIYDNYESVSKFVNTEIAKIA